MTTDFIKPSERLNDKNMMLPLVKNIIDLSALFAIILTCLILVTQ